MEEQKNIPNNLDLVALPGFCVRGGHILYANQAARALLLSPGQEIISLLQTGSEEYQQFQNGPLYLSLNIGGQIRNAAITRTEDMDLFLLDPDSDLEDFRSMALISMELRNPLMHVISNAEQLLSQLEPGNSDAAARMNQGLMQLMRLVCNLSDAGQYKTISRKETRDVCSFFRELFEKAEAFTSDSGLRFSWEVPHEAIYTLIDPEQIERSVWNLISNAIKFTPRGGKIHAKLTRHGRRLSLTVTDSGSGIAENIRSTLFRRYHRMPGIEDSRFGLGLGMVIVRAAAANHGGTVLVDQPEATGTRITMTFAVEQSSETSLCSPLLYPDYSSGWDHALVELSDCLPPKAYEKLF